MHASCMSEVRYNFLLGTVSRWELKLDCEISNLDLSEDCTYKRVVAVICWSKGSW